MPGRVELAMVLRSMAVQGSWNYQTLIGTGFAFALLPALRWIHSDEGVVRDRLASHTTLFNSHPYLSTLALGAVARLERDRVDPMLIERFKSALRGSLGSLGDQLFWRVWRPFLMVIGVSLLLLQVPWWLVLGLVFVVYNAAHLAMRVWGLRTGFDHGLEVGRYLNTVPLQQIAARLSRAAAVAAGFAATVVVAWGMPVTGSDSSLAQGGALSIAAALGWFLGARARLHASILIIVAAAAATIAAVIS